MSGGGPQPGRGPGGLQGGLLWDAVATVCSCIAGSTVKLFERAPPPTPEAQGLSRDVAQLLDELDGALDRKHMGLRSSGEDDLAGYSILEAVPLGRKRALVESCTAVLSIDRAMGAVCGMAVGDALGHPFEFIPAADSLDSSHFDLRTMEFHGEFNKFGLQRGQWTDDAAMGLCLADSLIMCRGYDGSDLRVRFWCWWFRAYNNAFRKDEARGSKQSVGLGGNVCKSLEGLEGASAAAGGRVAPIYEAAGEDAGNGSLMRLAPLPVLLRGAPSEELYRLARLSSRTTHPGVVAGEACALLAHLIVRALERPPGPVDAKKFLLRETEDYRAASGLDRRSGPGYDEMNWLVTSSPTRETERCWNWRADSLDVAGTLAARGWSYNGYPVSADYFGSYSLDGLAVALWCVYHTASFDEAVARAVNFLGDADSHGSITGQLAGALYGYSTINAQFIEWLSRWDDHEFAVRAVLLHHLGAESTAADGSPAVA